MTLIATKGDITRQYNLLDTEQFIECFIALLEQGYTVETVEEDKP